MKAEAKAKRKRKGMWGGKASEFESPREYKNRMNASGKAE
jgi:endonuclease YncB( thermonuclease family)